MRLQKLWLSVVVMGAACAAGAAFAQDVYKCKVNGALVYQETPCGAVEVKGDTPWDRERERRATNQRAVQDADKKQLATRKERVEDLKSCKRGDGQCSAAIFVGYVVGLTQEEISQGLGEPENTQHAGSTYWYYRLNLHDGNRMKSHRVQILFTGKTVTGANVY